MDAVSGPGRNDGLGLSTAWTVLPPLVAGGVSWEGSGHRNVILGLGVDDKVDLPKLPRKKGQVFIHTPTVVCR